jgi:hypothetical protein
LSYGFLVSPPRFFALAAAAAAAAGLAAAASPSPSPSPAKRKRCHGPYPGFSRAFEEVCWDVLATSADGSVEVRDYTRDVNASFVLSTLPKQDGNFDNALYAFLNIVDYFEGPGNFENRNISFARTVPLFVLPGTRVSDPLWVTMMAVSPTRFPDPYRVPAPANNAPVNVYSLGRFEQAPVAARHVRLARAAVEADFVACGKALAAALPGVAGGRWTVAELGYWSPAYAFFYGQDETTAFDIECWAQVQEA